MYGRIYRYTLIAGLAFSATALGASDKRVDNVLAGFRRADLNDSGGLSKKELEKTKPNQLRDIKTHFMDIDLNKDGHVTLLEYADFQSKQLESRSTQFKAMDTDGNGILSKTEWDAGAQKRTGDRGKRFEAMDDDKNQQISIAEWNGRRKGIADVAHSQNRWQTDFNRADADDSGSLSMTELDGACSQQIQDLKQAFTQADANRDGRISLDESNKYFAKSQPKKSIPSPK